MRDRQVEAADIAQLRVQALFARELLNVELLKDLKRVVGSLALALQGAEKIRAPLY